MHLHDARLSHAVTQVLRSVDYCLQSHETCSPALFVVCTQFADARSERGGFGQPGTLPRRASAFGSPDKPSRPCCRQSAPVGMGVPKVVSVPRRHQKAGRGGGLLIRLLGCAAPPREPSAGPSSMPPESFVSPHLTGYAIFEADRLMEKSDDCSRGPSVVFPAACRVPAWIFAERRAIPLLVLQ